MLGPSLLVQIPAEFSRVRKCLLTYSLNHATNHTHKRWQLYKMTPQDFKKIWTVNGDSTSQLTNILIRNLNLNKSTISFLETSGLPKEASPYLTFVKETNNSFESIGVLTDKYDFLDTEFEKYIVIGSDGNGNNIVINSIKNDQIECLDIENSFASIFMNSSINELAKSLIAYREFTETILNANGEDALLESNFSDKQFETLKKDLINADSRAIEENSFWKMELDSLLENREFTLKEK